MNSPPLFLPSLMLHSSLRSALLAIGWVSLAIAPSPALSRDGMAMADQPQNPISTLNLKQSPQKGYLLADGVYLYGQSPQADQIGREYLVFQLRQGKIQGAIYYPQSEFNCFTGAIVGNQIKLSIRDPVDQRSYSYPIGLVNSAPVANREPNQINVTLKGYFPLQQLSQNDQRLLQVCLN